MKTSFNFEKHRKETADKLKKTILGEGFSSAREELEKEQKTPEYQVSKYLKLIKKWVENYPSSSLEEKSIEIQEYDISNQIPDVLKLCADVKRIESVEKKLGKKVLPTITIERKGLKNSKVSHIENLDNEIIEELKKRHYNDDFTEKETRHLESMLASDVVNELTNGALFDNKNINHVINGFGAKEIYEPRLNEWVYGQSDTVFNETKYGINFDPNSLITNVDKNAPKNGLLTKRMFFKSQEEFEKEIKKPEREEVFMWFSPGGKGIFFLNASSVVVIIKPENERFLKNSQKEKITGSGKYEEGFSIKAKISWLDIADYIVDLSGGKLYKITENK